MVIENESTQFDVRRYSQGRFHKETCHVSVDITLIVEVNGFEIASLLCTPSHIEALARGFLFSTGVIQRAEDIESLDLEKHEQIVRVRVKTVSGSEGQGKPVYPSGVGKDVTHEVRENHPGLLPIAPHSGVDPEGLIKNMEWLLQCSVLHRQTGGVHTAAVSIANAMPGFHIDDISRHNAVDKVIGTLLMDNTPPENMVLLVSGRISIEVLQKAATFGIPVLASRGAPTRETILMAQKAGITVVGYARPDRFTLFSHSQRIQNM
ncbi:formate dehydrogenase accessory sulfurtransferase FdhD [Desulfobacter hydrogenophilus]|uniref:Protein FdhD n=1 Tax=Desulfobacter hydrogenophilus TaxID=2291 RepID=A0A328FHV0_9BACT|nr:formate dehydrogenase accessory sulfurtransferase FdhD [Desulfobacter hydrogenophilus]NDY71229.1 formate dehydrogenase accessory sulfurtransferase FdhD [Desulfobacter hydrogenophilus]QBH15030.1 formate dehydrogenase accessory sulfurtransferase FdhD [Desulfobacter hydrogenophilus]RAM02723.1 formate dehydrogenase accessory sulfurtransferase FdhD [Desulfobacter hydrogenophilus]